MFSRIISYGSYLPSKVLTNHDLSNIVDTSNEWILKRTGISQRHIANDSETTAFMGSEAAKICIQRSKLDINQIDCIIVATTTQDMSLPSTACMVQSAICAKNAFAFDMQAACSGFVYSLSIADAYIKSGKYNNILIIGSEKMSKLVDWKDRNTCVLFGDGAAAVLLSKSDECGIIDYEMRSDGHLNHILNMYQNDIGENFIKMDGKEVFKYASIKMVESLHRLLESNNLSSSDLSLVVAHQANRRIIEHVAESMKMDIEQFPMTLSNHGNTSSASIPLALDYLYSQNKLKNNQMIALVGVGSGMTYGSVILKI